MQMPGAVEIEEKRRQVYIDFEVQAGEQEKRTRQRKLIESPIMYKNIKQIAFYYIVERVLIFDIVERVAIFIDFSVLMKWLI